MLITSRPTSPTVPSCPECPPTTSPGTCPPPPPCTCESCPEVTCPPPSTCPTPEPCPVVTCPTSTCPPEVEQTTTTNSPKTIPTLSPTTGPEPRLKFTLRGETYLNNSVVSRRLIGEGNAALLCVTDNVNCCSASSGGEFYYPNGNKVKVRAAGDSLYRNRRAQVIRLNRRNFGATSPLGRYRCEIPDSRGVMRNLYINIVE